MDAILAGSAEPGRAVTGARSLNWGLIAALTWCAAFWALVATVLVTLA